MNVSKISMPTSTFINFYYHFSSFTLFLTWLITPLLLYIIFTQSKNLKEYKWFLLNHILWNLALETAIGSIKPLILLPSLSAFPLSLIREYKNSFLTAYAYLIGILCCLNYIIGITATFLNRYLTIFLSTKHSNVVIIKIIVGLASFLSITISTGMCTVLFPHMLEDFETMQINAKNYDKFFINFTERSMVFVDTIKLQDWGYTLFSILVIVIICAIFTLILFIHLVQKRMTTSTTTKLQRSLIITSTAQLMIILPFLFIPTLACITCIAFQIPHTSEISCICFLIFSFHGILEISATLYFVLPYRRYLKSQFLKVSAIVKKPIVYST